MTQQVCGECRMIWTRFCNRPIPRNLDASLWRHQGKTRYHDNFASFSHWQIISGLPYCLMRIMFKTTGVLTNLKHVHLGAGWGLIDFTQFFLNLTFLPPNHRLPLKPSVFGSKKAFILSRLKRYWAIFVFLQSHGLVFRTCTNRRQ